MGQFDEKKFFLQYSFHPSNNDFLSMQLPSVTPNGIPPTLYTSDMISVRYTHGILLRYTPENSMFNNEVYGIPQYFYNILYILIIKIMGVYRTLYHFFHLEPRVYRQSIHRVYRTLCPFTTLCIHCPFIYPEPLLS